MSGELLDGHDCKAGDAPTLAWDLDIGDIGEAGFTGSIVRIGALGASAVVNRSGTIAGSTVTITLTPAETATAGEYRVEVALTPGPVTHPSDGWVRFTIHTGVTV